MGIHSTIRICTVENHYIACKLMVPKIAAQQLCANKANLLFQRTRWSAVSCLQPIASWVRHQSPIGKIKSIIWCGQQVKGRNNTYPSSLYTIKEKGTYLLTPSDVQVSQCLLPVIKFRGYTSPQKASGKAMPWLDKRPPQFSFWFGVGLGILLYQTILSHFGSGRKKVENLYMLLIVSK